MTKQKALCVATRCTTPQQFIETFHRFCDEQSFFVATMNMRTVGLETPFSIQLADKSPVLRGLCVVLAAYTTAANPYKRPGIRLGIRRLTPESEAVFYQLQAMRTATPQEVADEASEATEVPLSETPVPVKMPPIPTAPRVSPPAMPKRTTTTPRAGSVIQVPEKQPSSPNKTVDPHRAETKPAEGRAETTVDETRTPGSDFILPANPLSTLTDKSIEGFVECTLYEETGNFFRADAADDFEPDEPIAPPPVVKPPVVEALPAFNPSAVIENAFPEEPTGEPTRERHVAAAPLLPLPPPPSAPAEPIENESSMKAAIMRVEHSVAQLIGSLDTRDTSKPIDEASRGTPLPAGEAYARQVAKTRAKSRSKWLVLGGAGAVAAIGAAILVVAMRSGESETPEPPKPPVVAATTKPPVEPPVDKPVADVVDNTDGDEVAAVTATDPSTPVVGEGPCRLEVKTTPAGTMVRVDDATLGPSPITIAGPCTKRKIDLVHPRYKQEQRFVSLVADKPESLDVTLVRPTHNLTVTSNPSGATVYIAGRRAGTTPTKVSLMGFSGLEVKVEKAGFETVSKRVYSKVPEDKLSVTLKRSLFFKK